MSDLFFVIKNTRRKRRVALTKLSTGGGPKKRGVSSVIKNYQRSELQNI